MPPTTLFLICISGPDQGKRFAVKDGEVVMGRSLQCDVLSDDQDVAERHAGLVLTDGRLFCRALQGSLFLDGQRCAETTIILKQQLRMGRSLWQLDGHGASPEKPWRVEGFSDRISSMAGVDKIQGFDARDMFSEVLKSRTDDEIEEYFTVGTPSTTPPLVPACGVYDRGCGESWAKPSMN